MPDPLPLLDSVAAERAVRRLDRLTKPPGSLGRLERLAVELAAIQGEALPRVAPPAMLVFAADHGVAVEGVSAFPQSVTAQMVANFATGGAAINVFARQHGARLEVIDVGVATPLPEALVGHPRLVNERIRAGTANLLEGDAMGRDEGLAAMAAGVRGAERAAAAGCRSLIVGEMGIANTTASSALLAALTGKPVAGLVGPGTGIDAERLAHKQAVIERALAARRPDPADPLDALAKVGGLEIAAMAGALLGGARQRLPLIVDGFIATVAALVACRLRPGLRDFLIFGHRSREPGHDLALRALDARPLIDFELRLGEGTGAALAFPLLDSACRLLAEMATFDDAGIDAARVDG
ncbi:nicotinate-nucleotide--dimethylbenzimidazole phosphoribosyltransferase [Halomonas sp. BM-2019]|uniref:nicotinate-nucleotide--dimethylbenzimidazole phosphoribosyltransferase n=1 Tax=Halomonas sp. BM-2019 TaxID=2811227 RepID=UPI001B3C20F2|nr:MAG: nicotinate-nucleotide--dimethylbenzimidazole phosphoribosyltransferase [Halomonas sp. BM-2019]